MPKILKITVELVKADCFFRHQKKPPHASTTKEIKIIESLAQKENIIALSKADGGGRTAETVGRKEGREIAGGMLRLPQAFQNFTRKVKFYT